jgi:tRNA pseudouridine32 synthase/23S rRNA pseudouridine746 synthase
MMETDGEPNAETHIELLSVRGDVGHYRLKPHTGQQHQLRVHLAALGIPIVNDPFYPTLQADKADDFSQPLQLLARSIAFVDPLTGQDRVFDSQLTLTK